MGHTGSTHASKMDTDGLTRTAPAHAQTKESREKVAVCPIHWSMPSRLCAITIHWSSRSSRPYAITIRRCGVSSAHCSSLGVTPPPPVHPSRSLPIDGRWQGVREPQPHQSPVATLQAIQHGRRQPLSRADGRREGRRLQVLLARCCWFHGNEPAARRKARHLLLIAALSSVRLSLVGLCAPRGCPPGCSFWGGVLHRRRASCCEPRGGDIEDR
mmetsp:Transcript_82162/g.246264  ORF Transcript_82162/g.246264 Transcript_82162/m.246264 type:complete len:214 (+) Transcript_82162:3-644(+)